MELGRFDAAGKDLGTALSLAQGLGDSRRIANVHRTRADACLRLDNFDQARRDVVHGLAAAAKLPPEQEMMASGHLVEQRLTLLEVQTLLPMSRHEAGLEQARRIHAELTALQTPTEEIEAELVICDCLMAAGRHSEAEQMADGVRHRSRDLGLELAHCDALLVLASLRGEVSLARQAHQLAQRMSSPKRVAAALALE